MTIAIIPALTRHIPITLPSDTVSPSSMMPRIAVVIGTTPRAMG